MNDYFKAVTLGAFSWKNEKRIELLFEQIRKTGTAWMLLHFLLVSLCLNFPVMLAVSRLDPVQLYSRFLGDNLPAEIAGNEGNFNITLMENGYGRNVLLPVLGIAFALVLIIQAAFYLCTAFFVGISRMHSEPLPFGDRFGLAVYSSTLPVLASCLFGLILPTVHIIIFYFIVMFFVFQRSKCYAQMAE